MKVSREQSLFESFLESEVGLKIIPQQQLFSYTKIYCGFFGFSRP